MNETKKKTEKEDRERKQRKKATIALHAALFTKLREQYDHSNTLNLDVRSQMGAT